MPADDDQVGVLGGRDQVSGGVAGHRVGVGPDVGVASAVGGEQAVGQDPGLALDGDLVDHQGHHLARGGPGLHRPRVGRDHLEAGAAQLGLGEGEGQGGVVGTVHVQADHHPGAGFGRCLAVDLASGPGHHDDRALRVAGGGHAVGAQQQPGEAARPREPRTSSWASAPSSGSRAPGTPSMPTYSVGTAKARP